MTCTYATGPRTESAWMLARARRQGYGLAFTGWERGYLIMSELRADIGALRRRATGFGAEADDHRAVAAEDVPGIETDILGFGEISLMLHDQYRAAHALKERAWTDHGAQTDEHAKKLDQSASGYERREADGVSALDNTETSGPSPSGSGSNVVGPSQGPAFKMHGPGIQEVVPGTGDIRPQMPAGVQPDPAIGAPAAEVRPQMPAGVRADPAIGPPAPMNNGPVAPAPGPGQMEHIQGGISEGPAMNPSPPPQKYWTPDGPVWVTPPPPPAEPPLSGPAPTHPA